MVTAITGGGEGERYLQVLKRLKVTLKRGEARFIDARTLEVGDEKVEGKAIVVATGTVDFIPPIDGLHDVRFWGWKEALTASRQPKSIAIIGGGPVACEIATFMPLVWNACRDPAVSIRGAPPRGRGDFRTRQGERLRRWG